MSKFNQGDAVIAELPNGFYSNAIELFVVAQSDEVVTCLYFDGVKPVSVIIPADWLKMREPQDETTLPPPHFSNLE